MGSDLLGMALKMTSGKVTTLILQLHYSYVSEEINYRNCEEMGRGP
jgi:hypothetical protein